MNLINQYWDILIITVFVIALSFVLLLLVVWARKGNKGANLAAATFASLAPDPLFEKNYKIVKEAENQIKGEEKESGDPPTT